ncbi:MAG: aminoacyl-tRNA hydrolase [Nitrospirae bacterium]|nr:aminoacyl-tRNA hydrolase [Nitrospirota bacterium]
MPIRVTPHIALADDELTLRPVLASGPGGQHVNKAATAIMLRFDAARSPSLPEGVRRRLLALAGARATGEGEIVIHAERYRSQRMNRDDAIGRLCDLIREAAAPVKARRPTRPGRAARERRMAGKRQRGDAKRLRGPVDDPDA